MTSGLKLEIIDATHGQVDADVQKFMESIEIKTSYVSDMITFLIDNVDGSRASEASVTWFD